MEWHYHTTTSLHQSQKLVSVQQMKTLLMLHDPTQPSLFSSLLKRAYGIVYGIRLSVRASVRPCILPSVCRQETNIFICSLCCEILTLCVIFSSLQSCELMELRCLCFRPSIRGWTSLKNSHMQPLLRTITAVRDFLCYEPLKGHTKLRFESLRCNEIFDFLSASTL